MGLIFLSEQGNMTSNVTSKTKISVVISSPDPNANDGNISDNRWHIYLRPGQTFDLTFQNLTMGSDSNCSLNFLAVFNGSSVNEANVLEKYVGLMYG